ncbi:pheromone-binding protein Gp-9-like isoform X2 [Odontomachus brunneus]|uniref:pheromone-binding protein Gp-9-like isoform X2 n=1 Tax=Odontomachus brunneus TaxID=486640 RepID=UPI0013F26495|nr:pheromone-binding protein Gp-9-like isoform X2 [Odontomachus brunneus]
MKRMLLLFFTLIVATMSFEDIAERIASTLEMTREEVQTCFHKAKATLEGLMRLDEVYEDKLQIMDFNDSTLRVGCFFACLGQKKGVMTGARVNVDYIKEILSHKKVEDNILARILQALDGCTNKVRSITNECEVSLKCIMCFTHEMERIYSSIYIDE